MTTTTDDRPDPRHVRAVSGALSEADRMWKGLPRHGAMRHHLDALQDVLSEMLGDTPEPEATPKAKAHTMPGTDDDTGPGNGSPDTVLEDALDRLGRPDALTVVQLRQVADEALGHWLKRHKVNVGRRMAAVGYDKITNPGAAGDGWFVSGKNHIIFARHELTIERRIAAAQALVAASKSRDDGRGDAKIPDANLGNRRPPTKSTLSALSASEPAGNAERPQGQLE